MSKSLKFAIIYFSIFAVLCVLAIICSKWAENKTITKMRDEVRITYTEVEYICTDIETETYQNYDEKIVSEITYNFRPTDTDKYDNWDYYFNHKGNTNFDTKNPFMLTTAFCQAPGGWFICVNTDKLSLEDFSVLVKTEIDESILVALDKDIALNFVKAALFIGCAVLFIIGICKFVDLAQ